MKNEKPILPRPRIAFLLLLALGITFVFFWVIKGFVVSLLVAAIFVALLHPFYRRLVDRLGGHNAMASGLTVLFSLFAVIIPGILFLGILVGEAANISESAEAWVNEIQQSENLQQQLQENPTFKKFLPYQDEILSKGGELAAKAGSFVAAGLAAGARGTAEFFLLLFIMLYAMFTFLIDGPALLNSISRFTPLSNDDQDRLLGTFTSVGRATLKGTLIIGIVQGGLAGLSFWVAGIDSAVFWGAVMAVLSIIPGVGTALIWVPAVIILALNGQIVEAVGIGLWCAIVVGMADNVLRPLLIGKDTEMPDLLVMLTTLGGLALFGAAGIIIGPIIGALFMTIWKLWGSAMDEARAVTVTAAVTNNTEEEGHDYE
jgi:predicted PurR-regulated permease PerM